MTDLSHDFEIVGPALTSERDVIQALLVRPENTAAVVSKLKPEDFSNRVLSGIYGAIVGLHSEGRVASREAIIGALGDGEIEPGLTLRTFLNDLVRGGLVSSFLPIDGAVEVVLDQAASRELDAIASGLVSTSRSVGDRSSYAIERLDAVNARFRGEQQRTYTAEEAGLAALNWMNSEAVPAPRSGFADLDKLVPTFPLGELTIIGARPGMGKTGVTSALAINAAKQGFGTLVFNLEMTKEATGARFLTDLAWDPDCPVPFSDILGRKKDERIFRRLMAANEALARLPIVINEDSAPSVSEIAARTKRQAQAFEKAGKKLGLVIVDYVGLVRPSSRYAGNRTAEVGEITQGLRVLAKDLGCAVVAAHQLNRGVESREEKRPQLSDLRDSGSVEQDAAVVMFIFREAYYLANNAGDPEKEADRLRRLAQTRNAMEIIVAKNRHGPTGVAELFCDIGANAVRDLARR